MMGWSYFIKFEDMMFRSKKNYLKLSRYKCDTIFFTFWDVSTVQPRERAKV